MAVLFKTSPVMMRNCRKSAGSGSLGTLGRIPHIVLRRDSCPTGFHEPFVS